NYAEAALLAPEGGGGFGLDNRPPASGSAASPQLPAALGATLAASALQAAAARCLLAQRLLLLLGVVRRMGRAGAAPLGSQHEELISGRLEPQLLAALRGAAMALWLSETPAAAPPSGAAGGGGGGAAALPSHLEALQLGGPTRGGGAAAGLTPRAAGVGGGVVAFGQQQEQQQQQRWGGKLPQEQPLAAHFLRVFCDAYPSAAAAGGAGAPLLHSGALGPAAAAFLSFLEAGGGTNDDVAGAQDDVTAGPDAPTEQQAGVEAAALRAGWRLFCAREFAAACALASQAGGGGGGAPSDAGLAFLLGVSLACRLRSAGTGAADGRSRGELLAAASGHLFRAAAGLAAPGAAPLRG
ncbi:hypothetical protein MNEG_16567, partial [Monoraphidium neglectum]